MNRLGGSRFVFKQGRIVKKSTMQRKITLRHIINEVNKELVAVGELPIDIEKYRNKYKCVDEMIRSERNNEKASNRVYKCV